MLSLWYFVPEAVEKHCIFWYQNWSGYLTNTEKCASGFGIR